MTDAERADHFEGLYRGMCESYDIAYKALQVAEAQVRALSVPGDRALREAIAVLVDATLNEDIPPERWD